MEITAVTAFAVLALTMILVPGPDWAYILSVAGQRRAVIPASTGLVLGYVLMTTAVAAGVGALVASAPSVLSVMTIAGATYLLFLGGKTLHGIRTQRRRARDTTTEILPASTCPPAAAVTKNSVPSASYFTRGMLVSGLNPKALLIFLAVLPQFARSTSAWPLAVQLAVLGLIFTLICAVVYPILGYVTGKVVDGRPAAAAGATLVAGVAMLAVGFSLILEQTMTFVAATV